MYQGSRYWSCIGCLSSLCYGLLLSVVFLLVLLVCRCIEVGNLWDANCPKMLWRNIDNVCMHVYTYIYIYQYIHIRTPSREKNILPLENEIIFKSALEGDMLVPRRVYIVRWKWEIRTEKEKKKNWLWWDMQKGTSMGELFRRIKRNIITKSKDRYNEKERQRYNKDAD